MGVLPSLNCSHSSMMMNIDLLTDVGAYSYHSPIKLNIIMWRKISSVFPDKPLHKTYISEKSNVCTTKSLKVKYTHQAIMILQGG